MKTGNQIGVVHKRIIKHSYHKSTAIIALSTITSAVWQSYWGNNNYNHHGPGEVNAKDMTWPGHPNHS